VREGQLLLEYISHDRIVWYLEYCVDVVKRVPERLADLAVLVLKEVQPVEETVNEDKEYEVLIRPFWDSVSLLETAIGRAIGTREEIERKELASVFVVVDKEGEASEGSSQEAIDAIICPSHASQRAKH